ncbi:MAG: UvrB/UvrC motif-containing protein [candidate division Zixibacteria bacterium]|jgi:protein arginine kinase activator|nr:UvrB/UvrC motif-containing protein [candidate division Zixibacteria bacterium]
MLCQECQKREAEVNFTRIENNKKISLSLCRQCAAKHGFHSPLDNMPFPLAEILANWSHGYAAARSAPTGEQLVCRTCGLTFEEFARQGRFGCGDCYDSFRPRLEGIMRKIHGNSIHRGRNPRMSAESPRQQLVPIKEEQRVEAELRKAIEDEDFERAAELRDKLKSLREGFPVDN